MASKIENNITAADTASDIEQHRGLGNVTVRGTLTAGSVDLQRRFNHSADQTEWSTVKTYSEVTDEILEEVEGGVEYRFLTSSDFVGDVDVRLGA